MQEKIIIDIESRLKPLLRCMFTEGALLIKQSGIVGTQHLLDIAR